MKPSLTGLRAPHGTSYNLLRAHGPRATAGWKTRRAARFLTSTTATKTDSTPTTKDGSRNTPDTITGRATNRKSSSDTSLAEQDNVSRNALAESLHRLAGSLGSEANAQSLSTSREQQLLQSVTPKLQQLIASTPGQRLGQKEKVIGPGNLFKESHADDSSSNFLVRRVKLRAGTPRGKKELLQDDSSSKPEMKRINHRQSAGPRRIFLQRRSRWGFLRKRLSGRTSHRRGTNQSTLPRVIATRPRFSPRINTPAKVSSRNRNQPTSNGLRASGTLLGRSWVYFSYHLFGTTATTQQLDIGRRRSTLQVATHLGEVLSYAAVEQYVEAGEPKHKPLGGSLPPADNTQVPTVSFPMTTNSPLSHKSILAAYVDLQVRKSYLLEQDYDDLLIRLFNDEVLAYLQNTNYEINDVVAWAWILTTDSDRDATARLLSWTNRSMPSPRVPRFVLHVLLERNIIDAAAIQLLTTHLSHRLTNQVDKSWETLYNSFTGITASLAQKSMQAESMETSNYQSFGTWTDSKLLIVSICRLLKMATWSIPALLPNLATMLCKQMQVLQSVNTTRDDGLSFEASDYLTRRFNKALEWLASRTSEPYRSVLYQEQAQFIIVRRMSEFQPPLVIGREAYQAIVSIQLRQGKTLTERVWAELKSRAWPPYREDKTGLDATKKDEVYGISRAQQGLINLKEAGYAHEDWENSASVLSGWDVDRSPTIQTRRVLLPPTKAGSGGENRKDKYPTLWEARVQSTRTIQEAWAVFLNYLEEDTELTPNVFLAMFEKISKERNRKNQDNLGRGSLPYTVLAGDMPETLPQSPNPRDQVYTPSPPPTFDQFYQQYLDQFSTLDDRALCLLLPNAESLEQGFSYLQKSNLSPKETDILVRNKVSTDMGSLRLRSAVFTAYIRMLSKFATNALPTVHHISALNHAIHLVKTAGPFYRGPWLFVLMALETVLRNPTRKVMLQRNLDIVIEIIERMQSIGVRQDSNTFYLICTMLSHLLRYASDGAESEYDTFHIRTTLSSNLTVQAAKLVKKIFKDLVSFDLKSVLELQITNSSLPRLEPSQFPGVKAMSELSTGDTLPRLLYVPSPAVLHRFIRLLGAMQDKQGVIDLVKWMSFFEPELQVKISGLTSGTRHFRWILVAVRIISETTSRPFTTGMRLSHLDDVDSEYAQKLRAIVEENKSWGDWPTDDEVTEYLEHSISSV